MSTIILKWSHCPDLIIFRYSCFKIAQSEPRVAYKSVANKKKSVSCSLYELGCRSVIRNSLTSVTEVEKVTIVSSRI